MIWLFFFYISSLVLTSVCNKCNLPKVYFLITIGISVLSFFYVPSESADLYRHFETIKFYGEMGLDWVLENRCNLNPLTSLLFYVFSFVEETRLFTSFCTFVTYGFSLLLLYRASKFYSLNKHLIVLLTMFLLFNWNYLLVASNCRIFMLYSIIAYFFYMEFVENRSHKTAFVIYIASVFFHYGIMLVIIPRFFMYLYKPANKIVYLWAVIFVAFFAYKGVSNYEAILLESVSNKIEGYKEYNVFGTWQFLNSLVCVLLCCFYALKRRIYLVSISKYYILFWCIIVFMFLQISNYQVLYRESNFVASLSIVMFSCIFRSCNDKGMRQIIRAQSIVTLIYSFVYVYPYMDFIFII